MALEINNKLKLYGRSQEQNYKCFYFIEKFMSCKCARKRSVVLACSLKTMHYVSTCMFYLKLHVSQNDLSRSCVRSVCPTRSLSATSV